MSIYEKYSDDRSAKTIAELEPLFEKVERGEFVGATRSYYSDAHAFEVIGVTKSRKTITIRQMDATQTEKAELIGIGGFAAHFDNHTQEWELKSNPDNVVVQARLHSDGRYYVGDNRVHVGKAREFYDHNF